MSSHHIFTSPLRRLIVRRCSSFMSEAAVLVLVFGLLDYFLSHGRVAPLWAVGALLLSATLLASSVATEHVVSQRPGALP